MSSNPRHSAPQGPAHDDDVAVRRLLADAETFQSDTERFTALLTEGVVIVNMAGIRVTGKEAFRTTMARALETRLANVVTKTEILDVTFVLPDVAIASCIKHVFDENADASDGVPTKGSLTYVVVREDVGWRIALAQTTPMQG